MRLLFNLVCTVSVILGLGAVGAWVRSYYAADQLTYRRPFESGGERVAAQARSDSGLVTLTFGRERVKPQDLPRLGSDAWTKPGLIHFEKPLATPPVAAMAEGQGAGAQPAATQPAAAAPATPAAPDLVERLTKFDYRSDPRTGEVRVGRQKITVATDRRVAIFPHWAMVVAFFALPALKLMFGGGRRGDGEGETGLGLIRRRRGGGNSYDTWASRTPLERRRQLPLTRIV